MIRTMHEDVEQNLPWLCGGHPTKHACHPCITITLCLAIALETALTPLQAVQPQVCLLGLACWSLAKTWSH